MARRNSCAQNRTRSPRLTPCPQSGQPRNVLGMSSSTHKISTTCGMMNEHLKSPSWCVTALQELSFSIISHGSFVEELLGGSQVGPEASDPGRGPTRRSQERFPLFFLERIFGV